MGPETRISKFIRDEDISWLPIETCQLYESEKEEEGELEMSALKEQLDQIRGELAPMNDLKVVPQTLEDLQGTLASVMEGIKGMPAAMEQLQTLKAIPQAL